MTNKQHILLTYATRRPYKNVPEMPAQAVYDTACGCWRIEGTIMARSKAVGPLQTKKCDQETGEDQKGE